MDEIKQPMSNPNPNPMQSQPVMVEQKSGGSKVLIWILVILIVGALLFVLFAKGDESIDLNNDAMQVPTEQSVIPQNNNNDAAATASEAAQIEAELEQTDIEGVSDSL